MEGKSSIPSKAALPVVPNERTNIGRQLWGHGGGAIIEESVTPALNARSWQSGRINEGPPNSVTLSAVTHSKLRKALDGTGTQVATCMINRWTVKMNGVGEYIIIEVSQGGGGIAVLRTLEKLWPWSTGEPRRRRIHPRTQPEDKHLPLPHAFDNPAPSRSCQTDWRSPH